MLDAIEQISVKRQAFRSSIRTKQINSMMSKLRYRMCKEQRNQAINIIIQSTKQQVSNEQLRVLIKYASMGQQNAIIHLGNLIIDRILTPQVIRQFEHQYPCVKIMASCQTYIWLLHVFYQYNCFKQQHLLHLIDYLIQTVEQAKLKHEILSLANDRIFVQHGLQLLKTIIKKHSAAAELILSQTQQNKNKNIIRALCQIHNASVQSHLSTLCYSILSIFSTAKNSNTHNVINLCGESSFNQMIKNGLRKRQANIRCLVYQMLNNLVIQGVEDVLFCLVQNFQTILGAWKIEKKTVQVQLSYLMLAVCQNLQFEILQFMITHHLLVTHIKQIMETTIIMQVFENGLRSIDTLYNKFKLNQNPQIKCQFILSQTLLLKIKSNQQVE